VDRFCANPPSGPDGVVGVQTRPILSVDLAAECALAGRACVWQLLASCLILEAIAVERLIAVVCPLRHHTLSTLRSACAIIVGCWGYAMVVGGMPLAGWNVVDAAPAAAAAAASLGSAATAADNASSSSSTVNLSSSTTTTSTFDDCRFDTVVGASYVAFLYPGHIVPLCVIMLGVYVQVSRTRQRTFVSLISSTSGSHKTSMFGESSGGGTGVFERGPVTDKFCWSYVQI